MAGTDGKTQPDLILELLRTPEQFEFFQAVRLIERAAAEQLKNETLHRVGGNEGPRGEAVRFRALASLTFPAGQISFLTIPVLNDRWQFGIFPLDMTVSFMGLTGPAGVLPEHYTSLVIERSHLRLKDHALREFLDLFNHRLISLYFRAWEKYRFPVAYERHLVEGRLDDDLFTLCLFCLIGMGSGSLRDHFTFDDQVLLFFGGLFASRHRNAVSLEQILSSYFDLAAEVIQFHGQWLYLPEECQSAMPSMSRRQGLNLSLGATAVAGSRVWDVQSRIRIRLGPLSWAQFSQLLPGTTSLKCVTEIIRMYIDINLDFDVQLILPRAEVPLCCLGSGEGYRPLLGWNTWIGASPEQQNPALDAVFRF